MEAALELIGGKYKGVILWQLREGPLRYSQLRRVVLGATAKMLTQHLRELEADGLVGRTVYPQTPPRVEYALTEFGQSALPVLSAMCDWGARCLGRGPESSAPVKGGKTL